MEPNIIQVLCNGVPYCIGKIYPLAITLHMSNIVDFIKEEMKNNPNMKFTSEALVTSIDNKVSIGEIMDALNLDLPAQRSMVQSTIGYKPFANLNSVRGTYTESHLQELESMK
jgi:hypothetical protein